MLFKQRKPRKFKYIPKNSRDGKIEPSKDLKSQWQNSRGQKSGPTQKSKTLVLLIAALGMIIVLWYVLSNYQN